MQDLTEIVKGTEIDKIEMFKTIKGIMLEFLKGYPAYIYWGIIEGRFEKDLGNQVRDILEQHKLIEVGHGKIGDVEKPLKYYRLTPSGVDFAVSLSQLDYAEKMNAFTKVIVILTIGTFILALEQIFIILLS